MATIDLPNAIMREAIREVAALLRALPPTTHRDLSTLLPISGVRGVIEALAESIEALPDRMELIIRREGEAE